MTQKEPKTILKISIPVSVDQWIRENIEHGKKTAFVTEAIIAHIEASKGIEASVPKLKPPELTAVEMEIYTLLYDIIFEWTERQYGKYYKHMPVPEPVVFPEFCGIDAPKRYTMSKAVKEYWQKLRKNRTLEAELFHKLSYQWILEHKEQEPKEFSTLLTDIMTVGDLVRTLGHIDTPLVTADVAGKLGLTYGQTFNRVVPILRVLGYKFTDARRR